MHKSVPVAEVAHDIRLGMLTAAGVLAAVVMRISIAHAFVAIYAHFFAHVPLTQSTTPSHSTMQIASVGTTTQPRAMQVQMTHVRITLVLYGK